ncbi:NADP(H)-dependent aldo-keto reductase [Chitinimonas sp. JJ19]|uniref:NADP(H)-dependent aldo-keto reductase n=1 Tax=Chitinimonas sp. JJ19 TaxID=3109352 RepID=UPI0030022F3C
MRYQPLGSSQLQVSALCLGTMTFGEQNTEAEAHAQLDLAYERGINFIDVAEMYPVPARAETQGLSERYLGTWLARQARDKLIIATKVAGPGRGLQWLRSPLRCDGPQIQQAVEASLARLRTDYIDLYQLHWPARSVPLFGASQYEPADERHHPSLHEQLAALGRLVEQGKVRYVGLSNETPWGVCQFIKLAEQHGLPRVASVQNAFSLVNRSFEQGLAEVCHREHVGLLAYSALAFGHLSGKYLDDPQAAGRITRFPAFGQRYGKEQLPPAVAAYVALAREHGLKPAQMALAWAQHRWYVSSTIIGATQLGQLAENLDSTELVLPQAVLDGIEAIHRRYPNPAP